jgi:hypothetical protein
MADAGDEHYEHERPAAAPAAGVAPAQRWPLPSPLGHAPGHCSKSAQQTKMRGAASFAASLSNDSLGIVAVNQARPLFRLMDFVASSAAAIQGRKNTSQVPSGRSMTNRTSPMYGSRSTLHGKALAVPDRGEITSRSPCTANLPSSRTKTVWSTEPVFRTVNTNSYDPSGLKL